MNIKHGATPTYSDHRDRSFPRTFGSVPQGQIFVDEFDTDAGLTMPDQNIPNPLFNIPALPFGCTGYTTSELAGDQDHAIYNPRYTYDKTLFMMGEQEGVGCDIRTSLKSSIIYGLQKLGETAPEDAYKHRRGQYFNVVDITDYDAFDDVRSAMTIGKRSVSFGLPWLPDYENCPDGILPHIDLASYTRKDFFGRLIVTRGSWHDAKLAGWTTRNGKPYLRCKSWQGKNYGDKGWCYISRELFNDIESVQGVAAFTVALVTPQNIDNVKHTTLEFILSYLRNVVGLNV